MNIFFDVNGTSVNLSKIREIAVERMDAIRVTFDDGDVEIYSVYGDAEDAIERLQRTIMQITPCAEAIYNVYKNNDNGYFHERVEYLALCADGVVRSLSQPAVYFDLAAEAANFVGCFEERALGDYPDNLD